MSKLNYISPNVHKFYLGRVVVMKPLTILSPDDDLHYFTPEHILEHGSNRGTILKIGHVIGFGINTHNEIIISIKWADGGESAIHPDNLRVLS